MVIIFFFGLVVTGYSIYGLYKMYTGFDEFYVKTCSDWMWIIGITLALLTVGPTMIYFGYTTPGSQIHHVVDNHNGTLTVTEYSISGDSTIMTNIKSPKDTYGVVTDVQHHQRLMGKVFHPYTVVVSKLNDGRRVSHELDGTRINIKVGQGMKMHEKFYPNYNQTYNY